jgi:dihydrofolate synthase/folylpolyglutamate synthase
MRSPTYTDALAVIYRTIRRSAVLDRDRPARSRRLLDRLDAPDRGLRVIHVTGTKGKGSVCALLVATLHANGYRVGLYTSPHLHSLRERIQVDGLPITPEDLATLVARLNPHLSVMPAVALPETMTALALMYFAEQAVDVAVVEVHVGGQYDATNVFDPSSVLAAVLNVVDYDHTDLLGASLADIARHKLGIVKPGRPLVSAPQSAEALREVRRVTAAQAVPLTLLGEDVAFTVAPPGADGQSVVVDGERYHTNLRGAHQGVNLALAVAAADVLDPDALPLSDRHAGWSQVVWPGRLEGVRVDAADWLLDIAHNAAAGRALGGYLDAVYPEARRVVVFGAKADKDAGAILRAVLRAGDALVLTQVDDPPTDAPEHLQSQAPDDVEIHVTTAAAHALEVADRIAAGGDLRLITGSLFVVGVARALLLGLPPEPGSAH